MILYFSGGAGTTFEGVDIVREFVSWGYVVAAVTYPPSSPGLASQAQEKRKAYFERDLFNLTPTRTFEEVLAPIDARIRERALDAAQIVEQIARVSEDGPVRGIRSRLASDRIGIMGFSFGGAISAEAKTIDPRFKAALNLDGWHFGSSVAGVPYPYFLMVSGGEPKIFIIRLNAVHRTIMPRHLRFGTSRGQSRKYRSLAATSLRLRDQNMSI